MATHRASLAGRCWKLKGWKCRCLIGPAGSRLLNDGGDVGLMADMEAPFVLGRKDEGIPAHFRTREKLL
jgi:hypothetical protein